MFWVVRIAVVVGTNLLALLVSNRLFGGVTIEGEWSFVIGALVLSFGNVILKPILALLTLPLIIVTFGLFYFALNVAMLALAEWIAPDFSIDGFWTYVGATIVVSLVNMAVGWLIDKVRGDHVW